MENLWFWIYSNLVRNLKARYEWGALFLFAKWKGLIPESINVKKFCEQMNIWFGKEYTNYLCSYSQVTCYLAGFFQRKDFNFRTWINEDKFIIPSSYKLRKDQKEDGFKRIHELCCSLEANYSFDLIQVKDRNR